MRTTKTIDIITNQYVCSHGVQPKGRGSWAFYAYDYSTWREVGAPFFVPSMTYADAKVWAKAYARANFASDVATGCFALSVAP